MTDTFEMNLFRWKFDLINSFNFFNDIDLSWLSSIQTKSRTMIKAVSKGIGALVKSSEISMGYCRNKSGKYRF